MFDDTAVTPDVGKQLPEENEQADMKMPHYHTMVISWGYTGSGKTSLFKELCKHCVSISREPLKIFDAREWCGKKLTLLLPRLQSPRRITQPNRRNETTKPAPINIPEGLAAFRQPRHSHAKRRNQTLNPAHRGLWESLPIPVDLPYYCRS